MKAVQSVIVTNLILLFTKKPNKRKKGNVRFGGYFDIYFSNFFEILNVSKNTIKYYSAPDMISSVFAVLTLNMEINRLL